MGSCKHKAGSYIVWGVEHKQQQNQREMLLKGQTNQGNIHVGQRLAALGLLLGSVC